MECTRVQPLTIKDFIDQCQKNILNLTILFLHIAKVQIDIERDADFLRLIEFYSIGIGIVEQIKLIPYDLKLYKLRLPVDLCDKYNINVRNLWDRLNGQPKDDLYDLILEFV